MHVCMHTCGYDTEIVALGLTNAEIYACTRLAQIVALDFMYERYMYIYVYTHIYMYIYIYVYIYMYIFNIYTYDIHIHIYVHTYMYTSKCMHL